MAQQSSVAQKIENDVRSTLNANLLKGKSDFSHATWFACVDILFENRFLVVWDQFVSYRGGYWFLSGTENMLNNTVTAASESNSLGQTKLFFTAVPDAKLITPQDYPLS